jgi:hypothetical protein
MQSVKVAAAVWLYLPEPGADVHASLRIGGELFVE